MTHRESTRRLRYRQLIMNHFWNRWSKEYIVQLRSAHQYPNVKAASLKVDDVVLLENKKCPRYFWKLARVTEVYAGTDGCVRACLVRDKDGNVYRRPVQKLHLLEIHSALLAREDVEEVEEKKEEGTRN